MRTKVGTLLGIATFFMSSTPSVGGSDIRELWTSISLVTESGDQVEIHSGDGKITEVSVTTGGKEFDFPASYFEMLGTPLLWGTKLFRSFSFEDGILSESQRLEVPIYRDGPSWDRVELFPVAVFHLSGGQVWAGDLWADGRMITKIKSLCE